MKKGVPDEWQARQATQAILQVSSSKHNAKKISRVAITTRPARFSQNKHELPAPMWPDVCVCVCSALLYHLRVIVTMHGRATIYIVVQCESHAMDIIVVQCESHTMDIMRTLPWQWWRYWNMHCLTLWSPRKSRACYCLPVSPVGCTWIPSSVVCVHT